MAWETIKPQRGQRVTVSRGVTVSWRKPSGAAQPNMRLTIASPVAEALGWRGKDRVLVQRDLAAGLLRLSRTDASESYALHGSKTSAVVSAHFAFAGLALAERQTAKLTPHRIEDGALIVELPAWAKQLSAPRAAIPLKEPPAKIALPTKEESALSLLRSRVGTDQVVRETGLSPRDVVRLAEQVKAERAGRAA